MIARRLIAMLVALANLWFAGTDARAQNTKAQLNTSINTNFPDNAVGAITPAIFRSWAASIVASFQQYAGVNAQSGTSYTIAVVDYGQLVTFNNAAPVAVTLPQASGSFVVFNVFVRNIGAGTVTVTPATSTINGAATLAVTTGQGVWIVSDGVNYQTWSGAGSGGAGTPGGSNTQIQFNNAGVFGGLPNVNFGVLNTDGSAVPSITATPTIGTSVTVPLVRGGTGAASTLTLQTTSGAGTTDKILFQGGTAGTTPLASMQAAGMSVGNTAAVWGLDLFSGSIVSDAKRTLAVNGAEVLFIPDPTPSLAGFSKSVIFVGDACLDVTSHNCSLTRSIVNTTSLGIAFTACPFGCMQTVTISFNTATDEVNWTAHGLTVNASVAFTTTGAMPAATPAIVAGTTYYVKTLTANAFTISTTPGGAIIDITGAGSATFTAYRIQYEGYYNTGMGFAAFRNIANGSYNSGFGFETLNHLTSGSRNTGMGEATLFNITTPDDNTAVGYKALHDLVTGSQSTAVGSQAAIAHIGANLTAVGFNACAGTAGANGSDNTCVGWSAGQALQAGNPQNTYIGSQTGQLNLGNAMTAVGYQACRSFGANRLGDANTCIGWGAGASLNGPSAAGGGDRNTLIGYNTGNQITTGRFDNIIGATTAQSMDTGSFNTVNGAAAAINFTSASSNALFGFNTGNGITTGSGNSIFGANVTGLAAGLTNNVIISDGTGAIRWRATTSTDIREFAADGTTTLRTRTNAGHALVGATAAPALTTCGTSPVISGTDEAGEVTMGTGSPTACTITFNSAYVSAPYCTVTWQANALAVQNYAVSNVAITLAQTPASANKVNYNCRGRSGG